MNSLTDTLWTVVRWAVPLTVSAVVAAVAIGTNRIGEEVRVRAEARLAAEFPGLVVQVQGASVVGGEGIVLRGVSLSDPRMPQQWRQVVWIDEVRIACGTSLADLAGGTLAIGGVRIRRPVVHAVRHAEGRWNLAGLARRPDTPSTVPVTIEEGTLLVDDLRLQSRTTLRRVQLECAPAADGRAVVRGSVEGDLFQRASLQGSLSPGGDAFDLSGAVEGADVSPRLLQLVAAEVDPLSAS